LKNSKAKFPSELRRLLWDAYRTEREKLFSLILFARLWQGGRNCYKRSSLLPSGKNGKKPKKQIGADGKLIEPEPDKYATRALAERILAGEHFRPVMQLFK